MTSYIKTYLKFSILFFAAIFTSCEDVVDVDVQTAPARLTIEASLDWEKGTQGNVQIIKLSTSTPYFDTTTNSAVSGASVRVTNNDSGAEFVFTDQNNGSYTTTQFVPVLNASYTLEVIHNGETYNATERLMPVTDITSLTQSTEEGFDDEVLEINVSFEDPEDEENFYLIKLQERGDRFVELFDVDDEFSNGNEIDLYYEKEEDTDTNTEEFAPGDIVDIELLGISETYFNFIRIVIEQSEGVGLFSSIPVELKGNCVNVTSPENYAYGFFRVTQVVKDTYTFE
ncbi:DUF4249 family protein [Spongiimicrobium sp. 3-5]|uniref:DUF4249 family protein n=1 Tax=Spongiimicrobium sp. 3-5 TaxID=3332596 RepID=UPI0039804AD8